MTRLYLELRPLFSFRSQRHSLFTVSLYLSQRFPSEESFSDEKGGHCLSPLESWQLLGVSNGRCSGLRIHDGRRSYSASPLRLLCTGSFPAKVLTNRRIELFRQA